jgi:hypothetical protein
MDLNSTLLAEICNAVYAGQILWKKHALERMMERGISRMQVRQAIAQGVIIESYPDDYPLPSVLLASRQPEPLHVLVAYDADTLQSHVITAYRPDLAHFEADLMTRRLV